MKKKEAQKRIDKLREVINYHRYLYHVLDKQEISDAALDSLKHELSSLEEQFTDLITPDSPTQRVGGEPLAKFKKITHQEKMISLQDVFSKEEIQDWEKRILKLVEGQESMQKGSTALAGAMEPTMSVIQYFAELKMDGFAISLIYIDGILQSAATRGDGQVGEDVTQNIKTIESVPLRLQEVKNVDISGRVEVRGEVYMSKKSFEEVNKEQAKEGKELFANPRNIAAGSIRQLDSKIAASRKLDFSAYELVTNLGLAKHNEVHEFLNKLGFKTVQYTKICQNITDVIEFWQDIQKKREKLEYQIDGIVVVVNDNKLRKLLGTVGKAPRWAIAFKFPAAQSTTIIEDIKLQIGRTGALTPVAVLKPVSLGGTTVTRATLHNEDEIKRLDARVGDTVIVERAGDVIPKIIKVLPEFRMGKEKKFIMPKKCPFCGSEIYKPEGEVIERCLSKNCLAVQKRKIYHFVGKSAFNVDGLGPKIIDALMENDLIADVSDIFQVKKGDLLGIERFADKSADNLIEAIEKSKKIELPKFIFSLGIRHIGVETAESLSQKFGNMEKISQATQEELLKIEDIGDKVAESVYQWFQDKKNMELLARLRENGVKVLNYKSQIVSSKLQGLSFVLTGEMENMSREEAKQKIKMLGGDVSSTVSKNTSYVVAGANPGSKFTKAKKLGVKIIDEKEFKKLIN